MKSTSVRMNLPFEILTILTVLTWRESCVLGELTVLQGPPLLDSNNPKVITRRWVCVSEDDSSAVVWNQNLGNYNGSVSPIDFEDSSATWSPIDSLFDSNDNGMKRWNLTDDIDWTLTDSLQKPMGPVMDRRWEGFPEVFSAGNRRDSWAYTRNDKGMDILSVRGTIHLEIEFCMSQSRNSSCNRIAIGEEIPGFECSRKHAESSLSPVEWKTLTLKYSNSSKTVAVYDEVEKILSCTFKKWMEFNFIRLRSTTNMLCRLHDYVYLHATKAHKHLLSPWIYVTGSNICIEMEIGLCAECMASIHMTSEENDKYEIGDVTSKLNSNGDGLTQWQHVRFDKPAQDIAGKRVRFEVVTHLLKDDPSPLWALRSFRMCKDDDAVRTSSIRSTQVMNGGMKDYSWPEVSCQKLSYNGGSLVSSNQIIQDDLKYDMPLCEQGKVGPHCAINCSSISEDANCRNLYICVAEGCTCSHGWRGKDCGEGAGNPNLIWLIGIPIIAALVLLAYYAYRKRELVLKRMNNDSHKPLPHGIVNPRISYVVPRVRRRSLPHGPRARKEFTPASYIEIISDSSPNPSEYEYMNLVKIERFENYVKEAAFTGHLAKEYGMFPTGQTKPSNYGKLPENKTKNRYGDLVASDDETRVILKKLPGCPHSDYINASYIRGYKRKNAYIATQWPMLETVNDFWRMIWQEDVRYICLLSTVIEDAKRKYEEYWPEIGTERAYDKVIVTNIGHKVFADYTCRTLQVTCRQRTRKIEHLHYTAWPDHAFLMYSYSIVTFLKILLGLSLGDRPLVVQSGAGVGRTGVIILCDISLRRAIAEGVIDVFSEVQGLRQQRANMLNHKQQYLLAHLAISECLLAPQTALPCDESLPTKIQHMKEQIDAQEQRLQNCAWQDDILRPKKMEEPLTRRDLAKNRYEDIAPTGDSRVTLKRYVDSDNSSEYISAVHVDGVKLKNQYLATQLPLPSTLGDFWSMIAEQQVELIIMLQSPEPEDFTCCEIVQGTTFNPVPYLEMTAITKSDTECYAMQKLQLRDLSEKPSRTRPLTILRCNEWECGRNGEPPSPDSLIALWMASERIQRVGPTVAVCHDGLTGCGLYLALSILLERMTVEKVCDIYMAIRAVRRSRTGFVRTKKQITYLYDAAVKYTEFFATYANFK